MPTAYFICREVKGTPLKAKAGKESKKVLSWCRQPNNKPDLQQIILMISSRIEGYKVSQLNRLIANPLSLCLAAAGS